MADTPKAICGIVMPISECDGRPPAHWSDVLSILIEACAEAGIEARLVSETYESNLIHKEIIANIYNDDIIICDVSGRNPNVFFELGIRMATQKPTVIVKDDITVYPFDTAPNRFIQYPRDLRHPLVEIFKRQLSDSLKLSLKQPAENSFIGQLGPFQIPKVESKSVPASEILLERLDRLERNLSLAVGAGLSSRSESSYKNALDRWQNPIARVIRESGTSATIEVNGVESARALEPVSKIAREIFGPDVEVTVKRIGIAIYILTIKSKSILSDGRLDALRLGIETAIRS